MSDFIVEIIEPINYIVEIDTNNIDNDNISIELSDTHTVEIINTEKLLSSDFPDFYHTKIIDFDSAVSGLLPSGITTEDVQDIIGISGIIGGTGIQVSYNDISGLTTINASGLNIGTSTMILGNTYTILQGLTIISGISLDSPTVFVNCILEGGTP